MRRVPLPAPLLILAICAAAACVVGCSSAADNLRDAEDQDRRLSDLQQQAAEIESRYQRQAESDIRAVAEIAARTDYARELIAEAETEQDDAEERQNEVRTLMAALYSYEGEISGEQRQQIVEAANERTKAVVLHTQSARELTRAADRLLGDNQEIIEAMEANRPDLAPAIRDLQNGVRDARVVNQGLLDRNRQITDAIDLGNAGLSLLGLPAAIPGGRRPAGPPTTSGDYPGRYTPSAPATGPNIPYTPLPSSTDSFTPNTTPPSNPSPPSGGGGGSPQGSGGISTEAAVGGSVAAVLAALYGTRKVYQAVVPPERRLERAVKEAAKAEQERSVEAKIHDPAFVQQLLARGHGTNGQAAKT